MPWAAIIPAATAVYGAVAANQQKKKAEGLAGQAATQAQINIDQLNEQTKQISKQNALDSAELERQMTPEVPLIRTAANQAILNGLVDPTLAAAQSMLAGNMGEQGDAKSPLLQAAIARAKANLDLGGQLSTETRNAVTRRALSTAGTVAPGGGLGLGRDIVPRDLGLTSLDLENQRLQAAAGLGAQESQLSQFNSGNLLNKIKLLQAINQQKFGQNLTAAQYGESIRQPMVGLDPASVANIGMSNAGNASAALTNQANIAGNQSQNYQKMIGTGLQGLLQYNKGTGGINDKGSLPKGSFDYGFTDY